MDMILSPKFMRISAFAWGASLWAAATAWAAAPDPTLLELSKRAFFHGREYFALRSGRAQMILQADRVDLGPAFTYLLFDAETARQSVTKEGAFNFIPGEGFMSSALEVVLGGFSFRCVGTSHRHPVGLGRRSSCGRSGLVGGGCAGDGADGGAG